MTKKVTITAKAQKKLYTLNGKYIGKEIKQASLLIQPGEKIRIETRPITSIEWIEDSIGTYGIAVKSDDEIILNDYFWAYEGRNIPMQALEMVENELAKFEKGLAAKLVNTDTIVTDKVIGADDDELSGFVVDRFNEIADKVLDLKKSLDV